MNTFLEYAIKYHEAGLKVIPFYKVNGSVTFPTGYAKYRQAQSLDDIHFLFRGNENGIALLCTDGIEAIDVDTKHDEKGDITKLYLERLQHGFGVGSVAPAVLQKTKSNGYHFIYRSDKAEGNQKLTFREESKEAVIETRGIGGLLFVYPTEGYSVLNGDLTAIPTINPFERSVFINSAKELNQRKPVEVVREVRKQTYTTDLTPWDDYNQRHDVLEVAEKYGWTVVQQFGGVTRLNKPGSNSRDVHASIVTAKDGTKVFYPFTTATNYDPEKCYNPFAMFAIEEHNGNFRNATLEIRSKGYGTNVLTIRENRLDAKQIGLEAKNGEGLIERVKKTRFDYTAPIEKGDIVLKYRTETRFYDVAGLGMMGVFTGHEKSGKSFVLSCIVSGGIGGNPQLNFQLDTKGKKVLWFDTEQSDYFYRLTQKRILDNAGLGMNVDYYDAYWLRGFNQDERLLAIKEIIKATEDVSVVVVDGIVDLVKDYNSIEQSQGVVGELMSLTAQYNILLFGVLHLNKGDGKIRGHIGSEIKNKCDFIINVHRNKEEDYYEVSNPTARFIPFPAFDFKREETGEAVYDNNFEVKEQGPNSFPVAVSNTIATRPAPDEDIPF